MIDWALLPSPGDFMPKHKMFFLLLYIALTSSASFAVDLAGKWLFTQKDGALQEFTLNFIETTCKTQTGQVLYMIEGEWPGVKVWAASIETVEEKTYLTWWRAYNGSFDDEYSVILSHSENEISLGGDFELQEMVKMTRVTNGDNQS